MPYIVSSVPDFWLMPNHYASTATTSISSDVWYQNSCQQTGGVLVSWTSSSETPVYYNVIVTQDSMFLPTGYGALYYHSIPTTVRAIQSGYLPLTPPRPRLARPAVVRANLLRGRRALRRSIDLFRMLRPADEVRTFLGGEPLLIHGRRFDYRLQKRDNLLHHSMHPRSHHIPYKLQLLDKAGRYLAQGCTVIADTPVIDQVVALILHIEHDESVVLNNTNWDPPLPMIRLPEAA